jgi:hypothetical protein
MWLLIFPEWRSYGLPKTLSFYQRELRFPLHRGRLHLTARQELDLTTYVGTDYFRVDIIDYTISELDTLIEWFEWDLTTDPTFSGSFVTTYNVGDSLPRTVNFHNFRAASMFIEPKHLNPKHNLLF